MYKKCKTIREAKWIRYHVVGEGMAMSMGKREYYSYASKLYRDWTTFCSGCLWVEAKKEANNG